MDSTCLSGCQRNGDSAESVPASRCYTQKMTVWMNKYYMSCCCPLKNLTLMDRSRAGSRQWKEKPAGETSERRRERERGKPKRKNRFKRLAPGCETMLAYAERNNTLTGSQWIVGTHKLQSFRRGKAQSIQSNLWMKGEV